MSALNGHVPVPTDTGTGVDVNTLWSYQLWESPDGQVWTVTIDNTGAFTSTAIQPRVTEDGRLRVTEDGRLRVTEDA